MKNLSVFLVIFAIAFSFSNNAFAQKKKKKKKLSLKKVMKLADEEFYHRHFKSADELYREWLTQKPSEFYPAYQIARCNEQMENIEEAIKWYESAYSIDKNGNDTLLFNLGRVYKESEKYPEAISTYEEFLKIWPSKTDDYYFHTKLDIEGCKYAQIEMKKKPQYAVKHLEFNSKTHDNFPSMYINENDTFLIYTSHRDGATGKDEFQGLGEGNNSDLWIVQKQEDSTYSNPENLGKNVNTKENDGTSTFNKDFTTMYYSITRGGDGKDYNCSIYKSVFNQESKTWGDYEKLEGINSEEEIVVNSRGKTKMVATYDVQPTISPDGNVMYFVSGRSGGEGGMDLWYSTKSGEAWSDPVNAGKSINTYFDEISPFFSEDGNRLYFASSGHLGFGGYDIYYVEGGHGNWGDVKHMGYPVNTSWDDFGSVWYNGGKNGYISSNRLAGTGSDDIYEVTFIPEPPLEITVHGVIRDKKTMQPIPFATAILFKVTDQGQIPIDTFQTDQSARYNFALEGETDYVVMGNAPEYLAYEEEFTTKGMTGKKDIEKNIDILLEKIEIDQPIVLQNIYYDYDKWDLRPASVTELSRVVKIMKENPTIEIEIGSHTDSNGSEPYNLVLSKKRAQSVVNFLTENGIDRKRLTYMGYGESQLLINPEKSDEDEQANRRTEFRIKSMNYKGK